MSDNIKAMSAMTRADGTVFVALPEDLEVAKLNDLRYELEQFYGVLVKLVIGTTSSNLLVGDSEDGLLNDGERNSPIRVLRLAQGFLLALE